MGAWDKESHDFFKVLYDFLLFIFKLLLKKIVNKVGIADIGSSIPRRQAQTSYLTIKITSKKYSSEQLNFY